MAAQELKLRVLFDLIDRATKPLKALLTGHRALAQSFKASRDQLKAFERMLKEVAAFRALRDGMRETATALQAAQQRLHALKERIQASDAPTQAMSRKFSQASLAVQQLNQHYQEQRSRLKGLHSRLVKAGLQMGRLGEHERRLRSDIAATNATLSTQQTQLTRLATSERHLANARERMHTLQRRAAHWAVAGYATRTTGQHALHALVHPVSEAKQVENETQRIRALGLGEAASQDALQFARTLHTYGTSTTENLTLMRDALSVFADVPHAKQALPLLAKIKFANAALYGSEDAAEHDTRFLNMLKVIELRGGISSGHFEAEADRVQKVLTATGGRVGPEEWRNLISTGGSAVKQMRADAFYYQLEPLIQEMGGHAVGTGLMSAYQNAYQGKTTVRAAREMQRLGLLNPKKVEYNRLGMLNRFKSGALKGGELFKQSPLAWLEQVFLPALAKKGITDPNQIQDAIATVFTNRTASNVLTTMWMQRAQIHKNERLNARADGIEAAHVKVRNIARGRELQLLAKLHALKQTLGEKVLPLYSRALGWATQATERLTNWMQQHAQAAKILVSLLALLAAALTVAGTLTIALAAILGPLAILRFSLTALGLQSGFIARALRGMSQGLVGLGQLACAHPLIAFLTALAVGAVLVWQHWDTLGPKLAAGWEIVKQTTAQTLDWLKEQWRSLNAWLNNLTQRFIEAGAHLIAGLASGITNTLGQVKEAMGNAADSVIGWFKDKLGIHSPSRVFAELGGLIAQGIALGIQNEPQRKIQAALADTVLWTPPIDRYNSMTPHQATPVHIGGDIVHITVQAMPSMDAMALARAVRSELEQRERTKRARFASRFTDH